MQMQKPLEHWIYMESISIRFGNNMIFGESTLMDQSFGSAPANEITVYTAFVFDGVRVGQLYLN